MSKANQRGRSKSHLGRFTALPHAMMKTEAWTTLSAQARAVYVEVASIYNGENNGYLGFSSRTAAERCNISRNTAMKALRTLVERGFIECVTPGGFSRKTPHAPEWRLTLYRCDRSKAVGSRGFQTWKPAANEVRAASRAPAPLAQRPALVA